MPNGLALESASSGQSTGLFCSIMELSQCVFCQRCWRPQKLSGWLWDKGNWKPAKNSLGHGNSDRQDVIVKEPDVFCKALHRKPTSIHCHFTHVGSTMARKSWVLFSSSSPFSWKVRGNQSYLCKQTVPPVPALQEVTMWHLSSIKGEMEYSTQILNNPSPRHL